MIVGSSLPLVGTGWAASEDWGVAETVAAGVDVAISAGVGVTVSIVAGVAVGVREADGVALPNTCVPLLRISNIWVMATGFPFISVESIVTLCFPAPSGLAGVKLQRPFASTFADPLCGHAEHEAAVLRILQPAPVAPQGAGENGSVQLGTRAPRRFGGIPRAGDACGHEHV